MSEQPETEERSYFELDMELLVSGIKTALKLPAVQKVLFTAFMAEMEEADNKCYRKLLPSTDLLQSLQKRVRGLERSMEELWEATSARKEEKDANVFQSLNKRVNEMEKSVEELLHQSAGFALSTQKFEKVTSEPSNRSNSETSRKLKALSPFSSEQSKQENGLRDTESTTVTQTSAAFLPGSVGASPRTPGGRSSRQGDPSSRGRNSVQHVRSLDDIMKSQIEETMRDAGLLTNNASSSVAPVLPSSPGGRAGTGAPAQQNTSRQSSRLRRFFGMGSASVRSQSMPGVQSA